MTPWDLLISGAKAYGAALSGEQVDAFRHYHQLLVEGNNKRNLTRITEERDVVIKHFLDSLSYLLGIPASWQADPRTLLDVGSGAGLPGIPLLLAVPDWSGLLLEATGKKTEFLIEALASLGLDHRVQVRWGRAEDVPPGEAGRYDLVTARAVTGLGKLAGWTLPYLRPGGRLVVSKGPRGREEIEAALKGVQRSGGKPPIIIDLELPEDAGERILAVIEKREK